MKQVWTIDQDFFPPGLNSQDGLIRGHWTGKKKIISTFQYLIRDAHLKKHLARVKITLLGHVHRMYDWDNFASLFKLPGDALVKEGIIKDDSPKFIVQFEMKQVQVKMKERKLLHIIIEDV